jgi:hypothetical protein
MDRLAIGDTLKNDKEEFYRDSSRSKKRGNKTTIFRELQSVVSIKGINKYIYYDLYPTLTPQEGTIIWKRDHQRNRKSVLRQMETFARFGISDTQGT